MEIGEAARAVAAAAPFKIVCSAPRPGSGYVRATLVKKADCWQAERRTETQVFHENFDEQALAGVVEGLLEQQFTQLHAFAEGAGRAVRVTKKGRVLLTRTPGETAPAPAAHDRQKRRLLAEGERIAPLVDMGVFTQDGRLAAGMGDKWRQINRFVELVDDAFKTGAPKRLRVVDFGCGKSYLTFILYYYLTQKRGIEVDMVGLDLKADVVAGCEAAARRYGYEGLRFAVGDIADFAPAGPVDMVVTLHACDTATDLALAHAVAWGAGYIFSVPCCQHELNAQMKSEAFSILTRYGIVQERVAALMTDAVRASLLTACGYKTQLLEFVEMEHTPKNILIRARRGAVSAARRAEALAEVERLCAAFGFDPALKRQLIAKKILEK